MGFRQEASSSPLDCNAIIRELAQGLDSVEKLAFLLQRGSPENRPPATATAALLIEEIKGRIGKAMAELSAGNVMAANRVDSPSSCVTGNKQSTTGKRKMQSTRAAGYRRRGSPHSCTRITSTSISDEYTWRKYGQKEIYSAKHPRSYFRCTYKFDRGCKASKQVQRSEEDPSQFVITYFGEHTCVDAKRAVPSLRETCIINFASKNEGNVEQQTHSSYPSLKQEMEEEVVSNVSSNESPSDCFVSSQLEFKESVEEMAQAIVAEQNESSSAFSSCFNYGMDCVDFVDFDLFSLDQFEFFQD